MKRHIIFTVLITLTTITNGQNIYHCDCSPQYDLKTGKDISKSYDLPDLIQLKLDSIISIYYHPYADYLKFKVARQYDITLFEKRYYKNYLAPYIDIIYSLYIPNKVNDTTEYLEYCVLISLDSAGNSIRQINLPTEKWQSQEILSKDKAGNLSKKLWQNDKEELFTKLAYDKKQSCFVWSLARQIEGPSKKGRLGRQQLIIINAHTGQIIENTKHYKNGHFL